MRRNPVTTSAMRHSSAPATITSVASPAASHSSAVCRATLPDEQAALTTTLGPVQPWSWARSEPTDVWSRRGNTLGRGSGLAEVRVADGADVADAGAEDHADPLARLPAA